MEEERIVFLALHARNYDSMVRFYRDLVGVPLEAEDHGDEGPHNEYSWHDQYFHFAIFPVKLDETPTRVELSFNSNDVRKFHARAVAAGTKVLEEPIERPWGLSGVYLDPDGNSVGRYRAARITPRCLLLDPSRSEPPNQLLKPVFPSVRQRQLVGAVLVAR